MRVGDILVISGNTFASKLIKNTLKTKWTHAAIYIGGDQIIEIDWNTKAAVVRNYYPESGMEYVVMRPKQKLERWHKKRVVSAALAFDETGNRYDWPILFSMLLKAKFPSLKISFNRKNHYICTELIDNILKEAGIDLFPGRNGDIFPHELLQTEMLEKIEYPQSAA
ncbi:hypothetical protein [Cytobacillus oceanisediminis]|uniref:hypothetical protein n=1 Tax=Cytobacillus oceanisediminis TaxID=665099 RepID=UPI001FB1E041|nr:hypothetical protein [Cytobacillus oceanisediminis]UOE57997.1 hypothetical protein IRB79_27400 [Cytobacillus oceanisediminis]